MSSSISEPVDPADALPVFGSPDAPVDPGVEVSPRPLAEVGVLPLGGEADPIHAADLPIGEVGQLPGVPIEE